MILPVRFAVFGVGGLGWRGKQYSRRRRKWNRKAVDKRRGRWTGRGCRSTQYRLRRWRNGGVGSVRLPRCQHGRAQKGRGPRRPPILSISLRVTPEVSFMVFVFLRFFDIVSAPWV